MYRIVKKRVLNPTVTMMEIEAPAVARKAETGVAKLSPAAHRNRWPKWRAPIPDSISNLFWKSLDGGSRP